MKLSTDLSIVILIEDGVNQEDVASVRELLLKAGVAVVTASPRQPEVKAWDKDDWGIRLKTDRTLDRISFEEHDGLFLPGGPLSADTLRRNPRAVDIIRQFFGCGKTVAAIGHGLQLLIEADAVDGRRVTGSPSLKADIVAAGGSWEEAAVVADNGLITCNGDLPLAAFGQQLLEQLRHGIHQRSETII